MIYCLLLFLMMNGPLAWSSVEDSVLLVNKKKNELLLATYPQNSEESKYNIHHTFHVTLGLVQGDKEDEDDLKTPEGVYFLRNALRPPHLDKRFGALGIVMNFPNLWDQIIGRSGNGIMLHGTFDKDRLKRNFDSKGCIVLEDEDILMIEQKISLGRTPILIFPEMTESDYYPKKNQSIEPFFNQWVTDWQSKKFDQYLNAYHTFFKSDGKNKTQWAEHKKALNQRYAEIHVEAKNVKFYSHPKYSVITFYQKYQSVLNSKTKGHVSEGLKTLWIAGEEGQPKIIAEQFTRP